MGRCVSSLGRFRDSTLVTMLGARHGSEDDLDALFDSLDSNHSNSITRSEWLDFVITKNKVHVHRTHTSAHACTSYPHLTTLITLVSR